MVGSETGEGEFHVWLVIERDPYSFSSGGGLGVASVKTEGCGTQRLGQLLPEQNLFQLGRRSVLLEGGEDVFWLSLVG